MNNSLKQYRLWAHLIFFVLAMLACFFSKERVLFIDSAFQFFKILNFGTFNIEAGRYGTVVTQIPLLTAIHAGIPLRYLILIFSVSFITLYYSLFLICVYVFKNDVAGWLIIFSLLLCTRFSFFHPVTETHQGLAYCALLYAVVNWEFKSSIWFYIISSFVIMVCGLTHPVTLFIIVFVLFLHMFNTPGLIKRKIFLLLLFTGVLFLVKVFLTKTKSYEGEQFGLFMNAYQYIGQIFSLSSFRFFLGNILWTYYMLIALFCFVVVQLFKTGQKVKSIFVLLYTVFFGGIILLTFREGSSRIMMEKNFMPLAFLVSLPLLEVLNEVRIRAKVREALLLGSVAFSIIGIVAAGSAFRSRTALVETLLNKAASSNVTKGIVHLSDGEKIVLMETWALSFETILQSALHSPGHTRTLISDETLPSVFMQEHKSDSVNFFGTGFWPLWSDAVLNREYFELPQSNYKNL